MFVEQRKTNADGNKVLVTVNKEDDFMPEVVARHMFLFDTAQALGWELPQPVLAPATGIHCYKSLQQSVDSKVKKIGYCKLARKHMLSACIYRPKCCPYYEEVK